MLTEWVVSSEQSASGAVNAFLKGKILNLWNTYLWLDIEILHQIRIRQFKEFFKARTISKIINKKKRPLNEIQSLSQQNK
ncbi:hypothetical protein C1646_755864 [Rhizophagus diaphanus]|nr:hypothetical protein C1646_755864 [Rhizophagus diaphanus] [Rhizophagus sp. MUCL 43196]